MNEYELFQSALDIDDSAARKSFLKSACGPDSELLNRVESLLASHEGQSQFLKTPVVEQISDAENSATMLAGAGSIQNEKLNATERLPPGTAPLTEQFHDTDDEIPLGFLEPSSKPGSLGRLGHYEVLEVIGRGAFGTVLRAFDEKLHRVVAIKVMAVELASTSPARKRFLREAQASAAIRHENVVSVYAVEERPLPYLVMEYIPGQTLQQRLDERGPLDVADVLTLGRQIAEGLAAAHAINLIHRDIKPGNILLDTGVHDKVKITDFGLARAADDASLTQSGTIAGTPMYMAPEQALGHKLDQRADLFSFGSVLYQMVSGRPPFRAPSALAVLKRVAEETPRPIPEIIPEVPQWLCDLISRLHAKKPEGRIGSAKEVADLLGQGLAALQQPANIALPPVIAAASVWEDKALTQAVELPKPTPALKPRLRHRRWATAAVGLLLLLGGFGVTEATGVTDFRGTVIRLFSPEGTLIVEVDDPGISVKVDGSDIVITGAGATEIRLKPGSYTVEASKDGKVVSQELVTVTNHGKQVVRVSKEAPLTARKNLARETGEEKTATATVGAAAEARPRQESAGETSDEADRRTAEFVLNVLHGHVSVDSSGHEWIRQASSLPRAPFRLTGLDLADLRKLTDSDMTILRNCKNLTLLAVRDSALTDAGLAYLKECPSLEELYLIRTSVTDAGLVHLKDCPNIRDLLLEMPKGIGAGLADLKQCPKLTTLHVIGPVTDDGLAHLKNWKTVTTFLLESSEVSDAGLAHLEGWDNLSWLQLHTTPVSDAGLARLAGLTKLTTLKLIHTKVTAIGLDGLQKALPNCKIEWEK